MRAGRRGRSRGVPGLKLLLLPVQWRGACSYLTDIFRGAPDSFRVSFSRISWLPKSLAPSASIPIEPEGALADGQE